MLTLAEKKPKYPCGQLTVLTAALAAHTGLAAPDIDVCDVPQRHENATPGMRQFEFLLGSFRARVQRWDSNSAAWSEVTNDALWQGGYILDGRMIVDYWYAADPGQNPETSRGVNNRYFDPATGQWTITWVAAPSAEAYISQAELRGDRLVMWDVFPRHQDGSETLSEFEVLSADYWKRTTYELKDGTRAPTLLIEARRIACAE